MRHPSADPVDLAEVVDEDGPSATGEFPLTSDPPSRSRKGPQTRPGDHCGGHKRKVDSRLRPRVRHVPRQGSWVLSGPDINH